MPTTRDELSERIRLGEDSLLELKEVRFAGSKIRGPAQNDLADEIAAFANARGGTLVLGVHDKTRNVVGIPVERLDAVEAMVMQACDDSIDPAATPLIARMTLPDQAGVARPVMLVEVPRSPFVHQSPGGYLHRIGSSKRPIAPDHLARLFQQRSESRLIRFDETSVLDATLADLDQDLWGRFRTPLTAGGPEEMLDKLSMAAQDEGGTWRPTVAGLLLACRAPQAFLPCAFIQAVAYRGEDVVPRGDRAYQRDAVDITGPLDRQIFDACGFVRKNMWTGARKGPEGGRFDLPQYDLVAVFEAVTNAVAHRDYSMHGSKVRLRLFDNRLELYVPGMLANTMTPERLPHRQAARNEAITSLLARCPMEDIGSPIHRTHVMDKRGEGVPAILSRTADLAGEVPVYRLLGDSELLLTIPAAPTE